MAKSRRDGQGRTLRKGESIRKYDKMYVYTYTDPFGKRGHLYSKDLMKLREKEEQLKKDQLDGLDLYVRGSATVSFVFDRYISTKSELKSTTYSNYIYHYDHYVRDGFGKKLIADIKYSDVLCFYQHLMEEKNLSISTIESVHSCLHPTFKLAVRDDIIRKNPSDGVMAELKKKLGKTSGARHALTLEQQRAFLEFVGRAENRRWKPLFTVMLGTGCRIGEVIGLRFEDVDMTNRVITIDHNVTYYPRRKDTYKCEFRVSTPKTEAGIRTIPMFDEVYEALLEEFEQQKLLGIHCSQVVDGYKNFIFCNRFGNLHNPQGVNREIKRLIEKYNAEEIVNAKKQRREPVILPHFSCHHTRHTFCTRLCENDVNIKVIQDVMGHADIATTMNIYTDVTESKKKQEFKNLQNKVDLF